jgi:3-keto-5-aminohexanoate cleavage enzyme
MQQNRLMTPLIIETAVNGMTRKARNPAVPENPSEIAAETVACLDAGATVIHTHTTRPFTERAGVEDTAEEYAQAYRAVLAERPDAILYPTMAGGTTISERWDHHRLLAAEGLIRGGCLDPGSVNLASFGPDGLPSATDFVYTNSPNDIRYMMGACAELGIGPSLAIYEPGFLRMVLGFHAGGTLPAGALVKFYFSGGDGYFGGGSPTFSAPPIIEALELYLAMFRGVELPWAVTVLGGDILASPIAREAISRGGHIRVGLEDHASGASNLAAIAAVVDLAAGVGRPIATRAQAAEILGLPARVG